MSQHHQSRTEWLFSRPRTSLKRRSTPRLPGPEARLPRPSRTPPHLLAQYPDSHQHTMEHIRRTDGNHRRPRFLGETGGTGSSWPPWSAVRVTAYTHLARFEYSMGTWLWHGIDADKQQRYVYPLIAPPTPERLEADKKSIDEQFEKAFALVEQLAKDTEVLKAAEQQRTEKLDTALAELETVINDLKSSNRRREDEAQRIRDDVSNLKDSIPKALDAQKQLADSRLQEVNAELKSLKTIISQRMSGQQPSSVNSYASRAVAPTPTSTSTPTAASGYENGSNGAAKGHSATDDTPKASNGTPSLDSTPSVGRSSPFSSGMSAANVKIPEWQRAMASKRGASSSSNIVADAGSSPQAEAGGSSS